MLSRTQPAPSEAPPITRFDELFQRFYPDLFGLAYRVLGDRFETEDVLQEAFMKLAASPLVERPDHEAGAWLRRVCLNLAFNRLRSQRRARARLEHVGRLADDGVDSAASPTLAVLRGEQQARVRKALQQLPERQRWCLLLRHSGYSYAEVAATLDVAVGSVGVLLARAERAFRDRYEEDDDDPSDHELS